MTIVVYVVIWPWRQSDLNNQEICDPRKIQTLIYFIFTIFFFGTLFVIFAFVDSLCLRANLYDRAPVPEKLVFNKAGEDRLFLSAEYPTDFSKATGNTFENSQNFTNVTI